MRDLYATLFYKIKFTLESKDQETDLLWKTITHIKSWLTYKHNKTEIVLTDDIREWSSLKTGGVIQGEDIKIISENCFVEEPFRTSFWACKIIEPLTVKIGFAPRRWITEIGFEPISPEKSVFSCIVSYTDRPGYLGDYEEIPSPSVPRFIRNMWNDRMLVCINGIDYPSIDPEELHLGEWVDFWERIKKQERSLPYIFVSPVNNPTDDGESLLIDPKQLAIATGGNAKVYYAINPGVIAEMNYFCPDDFKCYDGAIRVYYPGLMEDNPNDAKRHRYLSSVYIREMGSDHVIGIIRRAIAQDANFYDSFFRVEDCRKMREDIIRKKRLEELKQKHAEEIKSTENNVMELAIEAEEKQLEAEEQVANLEKEIEQLRTENYNLRSERESYIPLAKENAELKKACNSRLSIKDFPQSPQDVFHYFEAAFAERIAFSKDAYNSGKDCTIPLDALWKALYALSTIMSDLYINGNGDVYAEFRSRSGIDVSRGEGAMTRRDKKLMRQFKTEYQGEIIDIETHITYPSIKQSIHFGFCQKDGKIVIGWCGEHMDNYSTRKVH